MSLDLTKPYNSVNGHLNNLLLGLPLIKTIFSVTEKPKMRLNYQKFS